MDGSIGSEKEHLGIVIVAIACPRFWPHISAQDARDLCRAKALFSRFWPNPLPQDGSGLRKPKTKKYRGKSQKSKNRRNEGTIVPLFPELR